MRRVRTFRLQFPRLPNNAEYAEAYERHDDARYEYTCGNGEYGFFKIHIEDTCGERTRPCAGAGKRYADEEHERDKKSPPRFCLKLFTRLFSFYKKKRTDISDDFFVRTPLEKFPRKEIDDRHGEHIACDTDDVGLQKRQGRRKCLRNGDRAAQFDERHHCNKKNPQVMRNHRRKYSVFRRSIKAAVA